MIYCFVLGWLDTAMRLRYERSCQVCVFDQCSIHSARSCRLFTRSILWCFNCCSTKTVCHYHTAGCMYGQQTLTSHCEEWLQRNLMHLPSVQLLSEIRFASSSFRNLYSAFHPYTTVTRKGQKFSEWCWNVNTLCGKAGYRKRANFTV